MHFGGNMGYFGEDALWSKSITLGYFGEDALWSKYWATLE